MVITDSTPSLLASYFRAYTGITFWIAGLPDISWMTGIWRFYLIGVSMVKCDGISSRRAFIAVFLTVVLLFGGDSGRMWRVT